MHILVQLFLSFMLIGLGAYGGGLVTIPLIQHELVVARHWLEFEEMARIFAVAQMTPGPIAINAATFTGFRIGGIFGSVIATIAVILPSIVILMVIAPWVDTLKTNRALSRWGRGAQLGVLSLILFAVWSYGIAAIHGWLDLVIATLAFVLLAAFEGKIHPLAVIFSCGAAGMIFF